MKCKTLFQNELLPRKSLGTFNESNKEMNDFRGGKDGSQYVGFSHPPLCEPPTPVFLP